MAVVSILTKKPAWLGAVCAVMALLLSSIAIGQRVVITSFNVSTSQPSQGAADVSPASAALLNISSPTTVPSTQPEVVVTEPGKEVAALVEQLGDDSYNKREAAQQKLLELTDAIEPQLRGALRTNLSDEARQRVLGILGKFEENRELGPSVITMHYHDAPLNDVLAEFSRQAKADLGIHRAQIIDYAKNRKVTIDLDRANFWESLKQITTASGLHPQQYANETHMMLDLNPGNPLDLFSDRMVVCGAFAIIPQNCSLNRSVTYGKNPGFNGSNFSLSLIGVAEPKLKILSGGNTEWLQQCLDDKKHDLMPDNRRQQFFFNNARQWWWQLQTTLREVPDMGDKIASLKGTLKFDVQVKSEVVEIDNILKAQNITRTAGSNTITIKQVTNQNNQYQVQFNCTATGGGSWEQVQALAAAIELIDQRGEALQPCGSSMSGSPGRFDITLMFMPSNMFQQRAQGNAAVPGSGIPQKLVWEVSTDTKEMSVPFEIKDLDLPHAPRN